MAKRIRASAICIVDEKLLCVRLQDPKNQRIYRLPPGGAVEGGETPAQAAERETREECGYAVKVDEKSEMILDYVFDWNGMNVECRTYFYRAVLLEIEPGEVVAEKFHVGTEWLPLGEIERELDYHPKLKTAILELVHSAK